jgi:signal transduction histidine kinase
MSISGIILFSLLMYSVLMWFARMIYAKADLPVVQDAVVKGSIILLLISFCGLVVMLYLQNLVRKKHAISEREKIRAVEGSLAKSQFLFNMSHDIRTPMNAIIGYTNLAMKEENSPAVDDYLTKINRSSEQLLELINDILEMSRIENDKVQPTEDTEDIVQIVEDMHVMFDDQMAAKKLQFTTHTSEVKNRFAL